MFKFMRDVLFNRKPNNRGEEDKKEPARPNEIIEEEKRPQNPEIEEEVKGAIVETK